MREVSRVNGFSLPVLSATLSYAISAFPRAGGVVSPLVVAVRLRLIFSVQLPNCGTRRAMKGGMLSNRTASWTAAKLSKCPSPVLAEWRSRERGRTEESKQEQGSLLHYGLYLLFSAALIFIGSCSPFSHRSIFLAVCSYQLCIVSPST